MRAFLKGTSAYLGMVVITALVIGAMSVRGLPGVLTGGFAVLDIALATMGAIQGGMIAMRLSRPGMKAALLCGGTFGLAFAMAVPMLTSAIDPDVTLAQTLASVSGATVFRSLMVVIHAALASGTAWMVIGDVIGAAVHSMKPAKAIR